MLTLGNPLGLLALLGIPAVLAIHFLQRKAVELPVSTLFLLERTQRDAASGRRFERIVPSIPLWMQLLAVLLLAWFLSEPRFQKAGSVQRIAIVLDSSASMGVFKQDAIAALTSRLSALRGQAASVEFTVLESAPARPRLYAGSSAEEMTAALEKWTPLDGIIDPTQAIRLARSLVSREGSVIYLTDTPADSLPFDARLLAVGSPIANVGFTGVSFTTEEGAIVWRAMVRNHSTEAADRTWSMHTADGATEPRPLHLAPGALVTLQAAFPPEAKDVRIELSPDRFTLDDTLPVVAPKPKSLAILTASPPELADLTNKLLRTLDAAVPTNDTASADLALRSQAPPGPVPPGNAIVFIGNGNGSPPYRKGGIIAERHPLLDNLNWQSLLVRESAGFDRLPDDTVILWQDQRPIISLREIPATPEMPASRQLLFHFDLRHSNAIQQPAFIVLLHRFAESIREAKVAPASLMLETGQPIRVTTAAGQAVSATAIDLAGKPLSLPTPLVRAPSTPCYLTVTQGDTRLLDAAVSFADTREPDFSACGTADTLAAGSASALENHTRPDPLWRLCILLLLAALLLSWKFNAREPAAA